jgi:F-type H+-transporting ATPase subunit delta
LWDFLRTLDGSRELREVLADPSIPADQKLSVIDALAERIGMYRESRNFIAVIVDHHRIGELREILEEYAKVADTDRGVAEAEITSAHALNDQDRQELEAQVARLTGSQVRVTYQQDPALLGGAVVRIGSTIYDGSLRGQLAQMKQSLITF